MYSNIGRKIKVVAEAVAIIGIIGSVIAGIVLMFSGLGYFGNDVNVGIGFLILIAGPIASWINSIFIYGFGELIEKASEIAKNTKKPSKIERDKKLETLLQWKENNLISEEEFKIKKESLLKGE